MNVDSLLADIRQHADRLRDAPPNPFRLVVSSAEAAWLISIGYDPDQFIVADTVFQPFTAADTLPSSPADSVDRFLDSVAPTTVKPAPFPRKPLRKSQ